MGGNTKQKLIKRCNLKGWLFLVGINQNVKDKVFCT